MISCERTLKVDAFLLQETVLLHRSKKNYRQTNQSKHSFAADFSHNFTAYRILNHLIEACRLNKETKMRKSLLTPIENSGWTNLAINEKNEKFWYGVNVKVSMEEYGEVLEEGYKGCEELLGEV